MEYKPIHTENVNRANEDQHEYGFVTKSEDERLKENIFRSPMEKLALFTQMLRREALYKKAKLLRK